MWKPVGKRRKAFISLLRNMEVRPSPWIQIHLYTILLCLSDTDQPNFAFSCCQCYHSRGYLFLWNVRLRGERCLLLLWAAGCSFITHFYVWLDICWNWNITELWHVYCLLSKLFWVFFLWHSQNRTVSMSLYIKMHFVFKNKNILSNHFFRWLCWKSRVMEIHLTCLKKP